MDKMNSVLKDKQNKLKELEKWLKKFKKDKQLKIDSTAGMPKTLAQCQDKISKLKQSIAKDDVKCKNKEDNKAVALGTSKINYMDPRISIAWCKQVECPIERVFPQTLRSKFAWAMNSEPSWQF